MLLGTGYNFLAPFAAAIAAVTALIVFIRALLNKKFEPLFVISYAYMILELFVYFLFWGADVLPSDRIIDGVNLKSLWSGEVENPDFYLDEKSYALFLLSAFALYQMIWQTAITRRYANLTTSSDLLISSAPNSAV